MGVSEETAEIVLNPISGFNGWSSRQEHALTILGRFGSFVLCRSDSPNQVEPSNEFRTIGEESKLGCITYLLSRLHIT